MIEITVHKNVIQVDINGNFGVFFTKWSTVIGMLFPEDKITVRHSDKEYKIIK